MTLSMVLMVAALNSFPILGIWAAIHMSNDFFSVCQAGGEDAWIESARLRRKLGNVVLVLTLLEPLGYIAGFAMVLTVERTRVLPWPIALGMLPYVLQRVLVVLLWVSYFVRYSTLPLARRLGPSLGRTWAKFCIAVGALAHLLFIFWLWTPYTNLIIDVVVMGIFPDLMHQRMHRHDVMR